jgi:hypothetical protein
MKLYITTFLIGALLTAPNTSSAGIIHSAGAVTAMTNVSQFHGGVALATFNDGTINSKVPENRYAADGMIIHGNSEDFSTILPNIGSAGKATSPQCVDHTGSFPEPIGGGGKKDGNYVILGLVATFTSPVTQFGVTLGDNGNQYITAWSASGALIGQVQWTPQSDASFVGLDSGSTPIKMIAVGNDNLFNGATYSDAGFTTIYDNVMWTVPECSSGLLLIVALIAGSWNRTPRRLLRPKKAHAANCLANVTDWF